MTDRKRPATDLPPPSEDSKIPRINIQNVVKEEQALASDLRTSFENQVLLADLHQAYINMIAKFLDPKSLLRLQLTCKALFEKGAAAQRMVTFTPYEIEYESPRSFEDNSDSQRMKFHNNFRLTEAHFKATEFRFRVHTLRFDEDFTPEACEYIDRVLNSRGTIEHLEVFSHTFTVDPLRFNKFLRDFLISALTVNALPIDYFNLLYVQKLEALHYNGYFPLSLSYISDSAIPSGGITFHPDHFDFDDLNLLLKKWASNEKVIKEFNFDGLYRLGFDQEKAFAGWKIISGKDDIPPARPIVIHDADYKFRLVRADESTLYIDTSSGFFTLSVFSYRHRR